VPPVHKKIIAPVIHYHVEVPVGSKTWHKGREDACCSIPWPVPAGTDEVTERFMRLARARGGGGGLTTAQGDGPGALVVAADKSQMGDDDRLPNRILTAPLSLYI
jgi:hypothetical protein